MYSRAVAASVSTIAGDLNIVLLCTLCATFGCGHHNLEKSHFLFQAEDKRKGGITLDRYQNLYAEFIGNPDENCPACFLFGPLEKLE